MVERLEQKLAVLFVCLGNICRSPMAEGAFRAAAQKAGLECTVGSAGTASYHIGETPDPRAIAMAKEHGVDISEARGQQLERDDFYAFTHIFALDNANLQGIKATAPRDGLANVALLMDAVEGCEGQAIKDPYYGDIDDFRLAWSEIDRAVAALIARFREHGLKAQF
ncbi:MAG: low molecular weight protein-tyrosine-phosphatase [Pseudomonadota bacterium]